MCASRSSVAAAGDLLEAPSRLLQIGQHELLRHRAAVPRCASLRVQRRARARRSSSARCRTFVTSGRVSRSASRRAPPRCAEQLVEPCAGARRHGRRARPCARPRRRQIVLFTRPTRAAASPLSSARSSSCSARPIEHDEHQSARRRRARARATPSTRRVVRLAQAGRIDQRHGSRQCRALGQQVARRARHRRHDRPIGVDERVEQARLADVRRRPTTRPSPLANEPPARGPRSSASTRRALPRSLAAARRASTK